MNPIDEPDGRGRRAHAAAEAGEDLERASENVLGGWPGGAARDPRRRARARSRRPTPTEPRPAARSGRAVPSRRARRGRCSTADEPTTSRPPSRPRSSEPTDGPGAPSPRRAPSTRPAALVSAAGLRGARGRAARRAPRGRDRRQPVQRRGHRPPAGVRARGARRPRRRAATRSPSCPSPAPSSCRSPRWRSRRPGASPASSRSAA